MREAYEKKSDVCRKGQRLLLQTDDAFVHNTLPPVQIAFLHLIEYSYFIIASIFPYYIRNESVFQRVYLCNKGKAPCYVGELLSEEMSRPEFATF